jgi:Ino eighty subunit 1
MSRSTSQSPQNKSILIQRADGEPLTRTDIQYDLLECIFSSTEDVFTDPLPTWRGSLPGSKVSFRELYVNAIWRSPRASKPLREKMMDSDEFATDFAKLALLANVGKIGTTMACELSSLFICMRGSKTERKACCYSETVALAMA